MMLKRFTAFCFAALLAAISALTAQAQGTGTTAAAGTTLTPSTPSDENLIDMMRLAQSPNDLYQGLAVGAGMSYINGKPYFLLHVAPQFQFGDLGIGLDGNIRINTAGQIRKEDFNEPYDYLHWINYVSYGQRYSDLYVRAGGLDRVSLGDGTIVGDYANNTSYDERKVGLMGRVNLGGVGGEALVSNLFGPGLIGIRPFVRPFEFTPLKDVWLLRDVEIGATGVFDLDTNAKRIIPNHAPWVTRDPSADTIVSVRDSALASVSTYGFDLSTMLWKEQNLEGRVYADYINFADFNSGVILGARTSFRMRTLLLLDLRAERSFFRNQFLPNYYNTFYERDRYDDQARPQDFVTKLTQLATPGQGSGNGVRLGAFVDLLSIIQVQGTYLHLDDLPGKDWLEFATVLPNIGGELYASATYTRKDVVGIQDAFALDERSLLQAKASVKLTPWLLLSVVSRWTFTKDDTGHVQTESMYEPRLDIIFGM